MDREFWESDLQAALEEIREEVHAHMDITEDLTNKARGNTKSFLTVANGQNDCFVCLFVSSIDFGRSKPSICHFLLLLLLVRLNCSSHRNTTLQQNICMLMLVVIMVEEKKDNCSFPDSNFTTTPMQQRDGEF